MKLCLVCSSGGHLFQLYNLKEFWEEFDRFWVTFQGKDDSTFLYDEKVYSAYHPTNRSLRNCLRNLFLAFRVLRKEKPDVILSTGAGIAVPFMYAAKLMNIRTIYIESATRVHALSMTGKLVSPVVDNLIVQWPELAEKCKKATFAGRIV